MKVILYGGTGMVGQGVLMECLADAGVERILVVGRSSCGVQSPKLSEVLVSDMLDQSAIENPLAGCDACFFCLGVSSAGMSEADYRRVTVDMPLEAARVLLKVSPGLTFCYVSGGGTDSSEKGRSMWARVKGEAENKLLAIGFARAFMFRPAYIQPMKGIKSRTGLYRFVYAVMGPFYPVWRALAPKYVTTTEKVGVAMIRVARDGHEKRVLENADINAVADG